MVTLLSVLFLLTLIALAFLFFRLRSNESKYSALQREHNALVDRFKPVVDADVEKQRVLVALEMERTRLQAEIARIEDERKQAAQNLQEQHKRAEQEAQTLKAKINQLH